MMTPRLAKAMFSLLLVMAFATQSGATTYTGSISGSNVVTGGNWGLNGGVSLSWTITSVTGGWNYSYVFSRPSGVQGAISHLIIELSTNVTLADLSEVRLNGTSVTAEVGTFTEGGSNPNMPGPLYGVKIDRTSIDTNPITFSFTVARDPVWGDFYAKDGNAGGMGTNTVWNSGFLAADPANAPANGSFMGHILRPDTTGPGPGPAVPEPGVVVLGLSALPFLAVAGLRRLRREAGASASAA